MMHDYPDPDFEELRAHVRHERRYRSALLRHHDCRDPDHPGCENCIEVEGDE